MFCNYRINQIANLIKTDEANITHVELGGNVILLNSVAYFILSNIENMTIEEIVTKIYDNINTKSKPSQHEILIDCQECITSFINNGLITEDRG